MPFSTRRVVMVTGSAGNLGTAVARAFLAPDTSLVLVDRSEARLARIYPELVGVDEHFLAHSVDLTDSTSVDGAVAETLRRFGRIDALVNTVGAYRAGKSLDETPLEDWDFLFDINTRSLFITCRSVIPTMKRQRSGRIVNVSSRAALSGEANAALYSASKSAALRLTESVAAELKDYGVTANCLLPGLIDTPPNRKAMPDSDFSRWVSPEAIAQVVLFLASDAAREISGAAIPVYGKS